MNDREPLKLAGNIVQYQCGSVAALSALGALATVEGGGGPIHADVSNFETQAASIDRRGALLMWWQFNGIRPPRDGGHRVGLIPAGIYPTIDGYIQLVAAPNWMPRLVALLDDEELTSRFAAPGAADDDSLAEVLDTAMHVWTLSRTKQQAMEDAQAANVGLTALNTPLDLLADPHLRERAFFQQVEHPVAGSYETPGPPVRMADGWQLRRPAPRLGEHGEEVAAEVRAAPPRARVAASPAPARGRLPLDGLRVLDLTVVWAGPYATMLLGDLGAEVIRIDNPNLFPTATRGAIPRPRPGRAHDLGFYWGAFPDSDPGRRPWNRVGPFIIHARSKLGATLDLRTELGRETFLRLVEQADVLVENNSAKVLGRLGLSWEVLSARNPRLIGLRMPSLGLWGPYADYIGFGAQIEALCGLTALRGYADLDQTANGATYFMDPASGTAGAFAVLAALRRRARTGRGELVEMAQAENLIQLIGEYVVEASLDGVEHRHHGNRHPRRAPQGVYPCAAPDGPLAPGTPVGGDRWLALSVGSDEEWAALVAVMGSPAWATDPRFATLAGRLAHHDEIDRGIAAWTATLDDSEAFRRCREAGVPAGPVLDEERLLADPHLQARGWFRRNSSPELGEWWFQGHLWRWDGPPLRWGPINQMGADNEYVYRQVLGLSDAEWAALQAEGHLNLDYVDATGQPL